MRHFYLLGCDVDKRLLLDEFPETIGYIQINPSLFESIRKVSLPLKWLLVRQGPRHTLTVAESLGNEASSLVNPGAASRNIAHPEPGLRTR